MNKWKITYNDYGVTRAKIVFIHSEYEFQTAIINNGIQFTDVVKFEKIFEAEEENTQDLT